MLQWVVAKQSAMMASINFELFVLPSSFRSSFAWNSWVQLTIWGSVALHEARINFLIPPRHISCFKSLPAYAVVIKRLKSRFVLAVKWVRGRIAEQKILRHWEGWSYWGDADESCKAAIFLCTYSPTRNNRRWGISGKVFKSEET